MPYAETRRVAHAWATERQIKTWVLLAPALDAELADRLRGGLRAVRADGARVVVVGPAVAAGLRDGIETDAVLDPAPAPGAFTVYAAMAAAAADDIREVGVLGTTREALEIGHRAGAGAIVGVAPDRAARRALVAGQPDRIVGPEELAEVDAEHYASTRAHRERVLLNPGPAVVTDRIHRAVAGPDLCHREPEYTDLFARVKGKLLGAAGLPDDWAVALIGGSGTAAMEAMTGAVCRPGHRILVCRNGIYGDRIATIAGRLGVDVVEVSSPHTEPIDPARVEAALDADPTIDAVAVIHHETTTGLLNPVDAIARVADARGVLTVVDAISAFGSEPLAIASSGIDIVAGTANKNLHGLPGVAFLLLSPRAQARAVEVPPRSLYFDIPNYLRAQARSTVPFTPAVPAIYGLEAALDELADEGREDRVEHYRARMVFLDREFERLGLAPVVSTPYRSGSVRCLPLPPGVDYETLHDAVKRDGYVIYAGLGEAARTGFRVCALGAIGVDALAGFTESLEHALAEQGYRAPASAGTLAR